MVSPSFTLSLSHVKQRMQKKEKKKKKKKKWGGEMSGRRGNKRKNA